MYTICSMFAICSFLNAGAGPFPKGVAPFENRDGPFSGTGLLEQRWLRLDRRPKSGDLFASAANITEANGVVRSRANSLTQTHVRDETQVAVWRSICAVLGIQKKMEHGNHVPRHFPPSFASPLAPVVGLAGARVRSLGNSKQSRPNPIVRSVHQHVRLDRDQHARDLNRSEIRRFAQCHRAKAKSILSVFEQLDDFLTPKRLVPRLWFNSRYLGLYG